MVSIPSRLSEPSTACADSLRAAGDAAVLARFGVDIEAELGRDHDLVAKRRKRFADDFLVGERAIDFGGVEQGDPALDRAADQRDCVFLRQRRSIAEADAHAAEADGRDLRAAAAQLTSLHWRFLSKIFVDNRRRPDQCLPE